MFCTPIYLNIAFFRDNSLKAQYANLECRAWYRIFYKFNETFCGEFEILREKEYMLSFFYPLMLDEGKCGYKLFKLGGIFQSC